MRPPWTAWLGSGTTPIPGLQGEWGYDRGLHAHRSEYPLLYGQLPPDERRHDKCTYNPHCRTYISSDNRRVSDVCRRWTSKCDPTSLSSLKQKEQPPYDGWYQGDHKYECSQPVTLFIVHLEAAPILGSPVLLATVSPCSVEHCILFSHGGILRTARTAIRFPSSLLELVLVAAAAPILALVSGDAGFEGAVRRSRRWGMGSGG